MFGILHKLENGYMLTVNEIIKAGSNDSDKFEYKISNKNCDEIFKLIDVEKLADEEYDNVEDYDGHYGHAGFIEGFNKAMELNKDKLFTVQQMYAFADYTWKNSPNTHPIYNEKLLQQPQEIEIEIEMENYGYCEGCRKVGMYHCAHADTCGYAETRERPKLDKDGCLILKRK
jgi:hypothetical protein